ncbi:hypothetical protein JTB14_033588 [Gonioctena quinquepunctata]|nr:hypothetical protein JTB14_033588 [Gonioctena quinquepunctata]
MSKDREDILKKKREAEKARLARIKNDPIKLAEYKEKQRLQYLKKEEKGQRENIKGRTPREQRLTRKEWKKYSSKYRQQKQLLKNNTNNFVRQNTPSTTDDEAQPMVGELIRSIVNEDRRANEAKRRSERQIKFRNKQLKEMKAMVPELKTELNNRRQNYRRVKRQLKKIVKSVEKTPKTRIEEMSEDITKNKELVKKALFGEVIKIQLEENYIKIKSHEDKRKFKQENDFYSRQAAGKKEFVTLKQIKEQKRYLQDTMENLHEKFLKTIPFKMGYSLFTRLRPFWVVDMYPNIVQYSWNFHEAGHGKGAPDGIGATSKRTADQVIASGGDITNLTEFASVIRERCPDSEDDDIPQSTYGNDMDYRSKLDSDLSTPGVSGYSQRSFYSSGDYVLVKYITRNTEYSYAAICSSVDDEEGELRVTFLKICEQNGTLFQLNEKEN